MASDKEALQKAHQQISEENLTAAEQTLLQAIKDLPPSLEIYNTLMELYFRVELYDKVTEYFKETTLKFSDLNLKSYFMVSENLLKANAVKECELILMLARKNHPEHSAAVTSRLLKLYLHPDIPAIIAFNFVKTNYNEISLSTEDSLTLMNRLYESEQYDEFKDFFFFIFNTSVGDIHRKKLLLDEYISKFHKPEDITAILDKFNKIGISVEPAVYFSLSSHLLKLGAYTEARTILEQGIENEPESELLFKEALSILSDASDCPATEIVQKFRELGL